MDHNAGWDACVDSMSACNAKLKLNSEIDHKAGSKRQSTKCESLSGHFGRLALRSSMQLTLTVNQNAVTLQMLRSV